MDGEAGDYVRDESEAEAMTPSEFDAIRARDATQFEMYHKSCHDRRALLQYVDELRAAAGKVVCKTCRGAGEIPVFQTKELGGFHYAPCPDCADLRAILGEQP